MTLGGLGTDQVGGSPRPRRVVGDTSSARIPLPARNVTVSRSELPSAAVSDCDGQASGGAQVSDELGSAPASSPPSAALAHSGPSGPVNALRTAGSGGVVPRLTGTVAVIPSPLISSRSVPTGRSSTAQLPGAPARSATGTPVPEPALTVITPGAAAGTGGVAPCPCAAISCPPPASPMCTRFVPGRIGSTSTARCRSPRLTGRSRG
ncbi:hypothetical protein ACTXG6_30105 [Pseudonocardia sp. Cha107L01]|uniref:hypothetical protein n=1 Tax=Pseudonocardia sp. Cha107L01 TaxID=3457576 RepID=UPI00403E4BB8